MVLELEYQGLGKTSFKAHAARRKALLKKLIDYRH